MRVIIRFSVDNETNSALRNKLNNSLKGDGFHLLPHTATYQNARIDEGDLATALRHFWQIANKHTGQGRIDHFWLYSDQWTRGPYKKRKSN